MTEGPELVVRLRGSQWRAELVVAAPPDQQPRSVGFNVPSLEQPDRLRNIVAQVRYTEAHNRLAAHWQHWHVKIYRCADRSDTDLLRSYLRQQAIDVQAANADLEGPDRTAIEPPWAVVPVHVVNIDGSQETVDGTVHTELALPPADLLRHVRNAYPVWFDDGVPSPDLYLLAVSPWMKQLQWPHFLARPAVEQLADFLSMGAGLDALHRRGLAHSDIKPDNVCRYHTANAAGFVLIDMDAATRLHPVPKSLRLTRFWAYGRLVTERPSATLLVAHDRFGFALVVLCAIAGREWVQKSLLAETGKGRRIADSPEDVRTALRRRWQDTAELRWEPLIDAVVHAFGRSIEHPDWSAFDWVSRLMDAQRDCLVRRDPDRDAWKPTRPESFRNEIRHIRDKAWAQPATLPVRVQRGRAAVEQQAWALAVRNAAIASALWGFGLIIAVVALALFALGVS